MIKYVLYFDGGKPAGHTEVSAPLGKGNKIVIIAENEKRRFKVLRATAKRIAVDFDGDETIAAIAIVKRIN